ncbi:MAG: DUF1345 domain-containing protein [Proteobacteria bacterium]|nr:DUF1345 domain-containing protein [Pseudomonadota bacterium]MBS0550685.1 DUF1345 domain-containing protein [Pseudomonadota bacterium]
MSFFTKTRTGRLLVARRRLLLSILAGTALFLLLPSENRLSTRLLVSWDLTALIYIAFASLMIGRSTVKTCHTHAKLYDESDWVIVTLVVLSATASFAAIFSELARLKAADGIPLVALAVTGATIVLSWTFTHMVFTLHYANLYYRPQKGGHPGGLEFPGDREPDYRDFLYYSFVIACAAQTADVNTLSHSMRRMTLIHGIVAFAFNTAILALMINVGASLV